MFSNSSKYAIRTVLLLAKNQGERYTVPELGAELDIPTPYLSKILQQLSRNRIISSTKGRGGGFYVDKENLNHKMIDVIVSIEGHNIFEECILGLPKCSSKNPCWLHEDFSEFKDRMEQKLFKLSVAKLKDIEF